MKETAYSYFLFDLSRDVFIKLLPGNLGLSKPSHIVNNLSKLLFTKIILQLIWDSLQILQSQCSSLFRIYEIEHRFSASLTKWIALYFWRYLLVFKLLMSRMSQNLSMCHSNLEQFAKWHCIWSCTFDRNLKFELY